jgi:hypothetical protein
MCAVQRRDYPLVSLASATLVIGAAWGVAGYAILWGLTAIVVTPRFSFSTPGLLAFLPVRIVLRALRFAEDHVAHHPFRFAENHGWIGVAAGAVGAALALAIALAVRTVIRWLRRAPRRSAAAGVAPDEPPATAGSTAP